MFISAAMTFRFVHDAGSAVASWLNATGGFASGITGITSNSGTGAWAHTGAYSITGQVQESVAGTNTGTVVAVPTTGQTVTILATTNCQICDPAGLLAALTIQFPLPTVNC